MSDDVNEPWRNLILERVKEESHKSKPFEHIFGSYRNVCDTLSRFVENDARRRKASGIAGGGSVDEESSAVLQQLDDLKATHHEMLKKKEANDQRLITAKYDVERLEKEKTNLMNERDTALRKADEVESRRRDVLAENERIRKANEETERAMTELRDEHMVLQMLHTKTSDDLKQCQMDRDELLERMKELKMKQIEFFNMETEKEEQRQHQRKMEQINEAMKTMTAADKNFELVDEISDGGGYFAGDVLPTYLVHKIEGHDASSDHTVLEYDVSGTVPVKRAKFTGSTQGIMRLDVNIEQTMVLGACNDKKLRIWGIADQRCRHELTGHTDKVVTAKFLANGTEVASGSSDRTVKLWDLRQRRCVRTCMVGSTVFDLVTNDKIGCPIISGHYDKKIRFWDPRTDRDEPEALLMENKITSLAVSSDGLNLLCATRDETLSLIDLRTMQVMHVYSAEQYRTTSDYSKCCISPGMQYIAAGSADGSVFVWNLRSTKLEKTLSKGHSGNAVLSLAWHPRGNMLVTGDKKRTVCLWR
ncbi:hypothetical protein QR680_019079 [Steinernema hermaphroditum]|uniref:Autophagy-related protein 16 domain-containing protein n=1 Tax=Steinernema hermaphroditum TaxID=289476 RepID=A0AA39HJV9_9BILA|nr:hypothetical protein QR680_019079 [Steinernema hermaphroditum]